ncbi:hypothetical protein EDC17_103635 [Sphingobacterium alimentarium]|uniref:Uncharacterized protein n=1 Tax=Sphingobacterium alimentarium TaxID=797292 RepID=A0A4R3VW50_9SPHI|nr:hypothetical protein [Sphingobacterium alimentarium]TCV10190.1 hypothetical protein EDC17_103635 [Sphingobacterium alimentarium]
MKTLKITLIAVVFGLIGCGQSNSEGTSDTTDPNTPGPVTEMDRDRYNLNPNDEVVYGSIDSVLQDSIRADSINRNQ